MPHAPVATDLVRRLRVGDQAAWFELARTFGPALSGAIDRFGARRFTEETVRDLAQETLAEVARRIDRFEPERGVRFSTWLLAIARHVTYDEVDRRMALKRGRGARPASLEPDPALASATEAPPRGYERAVFRAKVYRALESVGQSLPLLAFEAYRMRLGTRLEARAIASDLGVSEASVSRYLKRVRDAVRSELASVVASYSFTDEERGEPAHFGLDRAEEASFDEALSQLYLEETALRTATHDRRHP